MPSYDPGRRRAHQPDGDERAPVDRLLDGPEPVPAEVSEPTSVPVLPDIEEADPDLRMKIGVMGGVAATMALVGLWARRRRRRRR